MNFIKNYDSGMRRLGFLEILVCDCSNLRYATYENLGSKLWELVKDNQNEWLTQLGGRRGYEGAEVGKITKRIAGRFVKLGTELGLLTEGQLKTLTDLGRLFKLFRRKRFFIDANLGQQIILIREFFRRDTLLFPRLIGYIAQSKISSMKNVFDWFVNNFIKHTIALRRDLLDEQIVERLMSTMVSYESREKETKKRGYDKVKHIVTPRLGNILDLELISKKTGPIYAPSEKTVPMYERVCLPLIQQNYLTDDEILSSLAEIHGISEKASAKEMLKATLQGFDTLAEPPLKVVPTGVLQDFVCINSIVFGKFLILPKDVEKIENFLSKKFYGKVVFFEDMEGHVSHISINDETKQKISSNLESYADQIGD